MRIYSNCYELMSEMSRDLWEMGQIVRPHSYQNKVIKENEDYLTKELICKQYCLTSLDEEEALFAYDPRSREWAKGELLERINTSHYPINPGLAYLRREDVWSEFLVKQPNGTMAFDYTYNERLYSRLYAISSNVLTRVIAELNINPDTRQAIVPIFHKDDVANIGGKKRVPCSVYYNFMCRTDVNGNKVLHICYHQRSSDMVTHFGNDVFLAYKLMRFVASKLENVKPGYLYHTIDSIHAYKKDWDKLKTPISEYLKEQS